MKKSVRARAAWLLVKMSCAFLSGCGGGGGATGDSCPAVVSLNHGTEAQTNEIRQRVLPLATYPTAVCNDGTPASYRLRRGVGQGVKRWLVTLEGGGSCGTSASCAERWAASPSLMSSAGAVDGAIVTQPNTGIRATSATENPDFWDANVVVIDYCSSDGWTGDREGNPTLPESDVRHWHFRGRAVIQAVLDDLAGEGIASATEIFLLGGSAGGYGTAMNLDDVAARFQSARVVGAMDAAFFIDYPSYDPATLTESTASPTARHLELLAGVAAWGGRGDASCEATPPAEGIEYCRSPAFVVSKHDVSTPIFVRQSLADSVQTANFVAPADRSAAADAYRMRLWTELWSQISALTETAVFATADTRHGVLGQTDWSTFEIGGVTLPSALGAWYRDPCGNRTSRIATP